VAPGRGFSAWVRRGLRLLASVSPCSLKHAGKRGNWGVRVARPLLALDHFPSRALQSCAYFPFLGATLGGRNVRGRCLQTCLGACHVRCWRLLARLAVGSVRCEEGCEARG
jgi:hypothetical protein